MQYDNENIIHKIYDDIEILQFKKLLEFPNLVHGYTLRKHNINMKTEGNNNLEENYKRISRVLNMNYENIVKPHQTHTANIERVDMPNMSFDNVDGVVTDRKGILLATTSADCISLFFYDTENKAIGDIHSGWKGTLQQIGKKAVIKMMNEYNSKPENIICCICPSIRKCHFEVDENVMELFKKEFSYTNRIDEIISKGKIKDSKQKYYIDTTLINKIILEDIGLKKENIIDSGICTVCESDSFHSYRVDGIESGRNGAFIGLI